MQNDPVMHYTMPLPALDELIQILRDRDFQVLGPTVQDGVILYDEVTSHTDLPGGWSDVQEPGTYRLVQRSDDALFAHNVGPHSWKKFLNPERHLLWSARRDGNNVTLDERSTKVPRFAFLGVRSCELQAIGIQDKVFLGSGFRDREYAERRENSVIIAVNCTQAGGTCFCTSMNSGPTVKKGFDLALTEIIDHAEHRFVVESGSDIGRQLIAELQLPRASYDDVTDASTLSDNTANNMGRHMDTHDIKNLLQRNPEHIKWEEIASRCLSCANCTMVCPTCFCSTTEDVTDLEGDHAERWVRWDSCFTADFTHLPDGSVRSSTQSRYRQWMTHKLANWFDQFGTSGCVGCGRCLTWCPVGIDITEEVAAIRASEIKETIS